jgi:hypothetical protein
MLSSCLSPWAGQELVFLGGSNAKDYPPGLLTAEEEAELAYPFGKWEGGYKPGTLNLFTIATMRYEETELFYNDSVFIRPQFHYRGEGSTYNRENSLVAITRSSIDSLPGPEKSQASALACVTRRLLFPEDRKWVLRNLTTKEFVRAESMALRPEFVQGPFVRGLGFGAAVLAQICWSSTGKCGFNDSCWEYDQGFGTGSDSDIVLPSLRRPHRGVWVGHRFDITTEDRVSEEDGWKDVGGEVVEEIHTLLGLYGGGLERLESMAQLELRGSNGGAGW